VSRIANDKSPRSRVRRRRAVAVGFIVRRRILA
jgi:hypothetical protein